MFDLMRLWRVRCPLCVALMLCRCALLLNKEGQLLRGGKESLVDVDNYLGGWNASDAGPCL